MCPWGALGACVSLKRLHWSRECRPRRPWQAPDGPLVQGVLVRWPWQALMVGSGSQPPCTCPPVLRLGCRGYPASAGLLPPVVPEACLWQTLAVPCVVLVPARLGCNWLCGLSCFGVSGFKKGVWRNGLGGLAEFPPGCALALSCLFLVGLWFFSLLGPVLTRVVGQSLGLQPGLGFRWSSASGGAVLFSSHTPDHYPPTSGYLGIPGEAKVQVPEGRGHLPWRRGGWWLGQANLL